MSVVPLVRLRVLLSFHSSDSGISLLGLRELIYPTETKTDFERKLDEFEQLHHEMTLSPPSTATHTLERKPSDPSFK